MQFFEDLTDVPPDFGPSAVTIGKFDGMHLGHRRVIDELEAVAKADGLVSAVLTFDRNPLALLAPARCPPSLVSNAQKREALEASGVDATLMIAFTQEFSHQPAEKFIEHVLVDALKARVVLVGRDFRFGDGGSGSIETLESVGPRYGFTVHPIEQLRPDGIRPVSSTWVRSLLDEGDIVKATELLGHRPSVRAEVVHGQQRGRTFGYPTANLSRQSEGYVPADGVYAAMVTVDGRQYPSAVSIGNNPTFEGVPDKQIEAHLLDQSIDLYGTVIDVAFVEYIRGMEKFPNAEALVAKMASDEQRIRQILRVPSVR